MRTKEFTIALQRLDGNYKGQLERMAKANPEWTVVETRKEEGYMLVTVREEDKTMRPKTCARCDEMFYVNEFVWEITEYCDGCIEWMEEQRTPEYVWVVPVGGAADVKVQRKNGQVETWAEKDSFGFALGEARAVANKFGIARVGKPEPRYKKEKSVLERVKGMASVVEMYAGMCLDGKNIEVKDGDVVRDDLTADQYETLYQGIQDRLREMLKIFEDSTLATK